MATKGSGRVAIALLSIVAGAFVLWLLLAWERSWSSAILAWLITALFIIVVIGLAGLLTESKSPLAFLINKEERLSFSRLQVCGWLVMLLSSFLVVANVRYGADPQSGHWLNTTIPEGLLAAAGLSVGAAAATSVINGVKRNPNTKQANQLQVQAKPLESQAPLKRNGYLGIADGPEISQLVTGSEIGNWEELDWSKVQALLLTVMLLVLYTMAVLAMLSDPSAWSKNETVSLPEFSSTLATLLGISLAGYEVNKLANHSLVDQVVGP